jgi:anti-sigma regulatory factor (Ser/Thr protein kinase)
MAEAPVWHHAPAFNEERPHYALALAIKPTAVAVARELVKAALEDWEATGFTDDAVLVASELVTNAVRAEPERLVFMIDYVVADGLLNLSVWDDGPGFPEPREPDFVNESGRGLWIIENLSSTWGWEATPGLGGKITWAQLGCGDR